MKTTKINKGFYKVEKENSIFQLVAYNTDVPYPIFWMIQTINQLGYFLDLHIEFRTKKEALEYIFNEL